MSHRGQNPLTDSVQTWNGTAWIPFPILQLDNSLAPTGLGVLTIRPPIDHNDAMNVNTQGASSSSGMYAEKSVAGDAGLCTLGASGADTAGAVTLQSSAGTTTGLVTVVSTAGVTAGGVRIETTAGTASGDIDILTSAGTTPGDIRISPGGSGTTAGKIELSTSTSGGGAGAEGKASIQIGLNSQAPLTQTLGHMVNDPAAGAAPSGTKRAKSVELVGEFFTDGATGLDMVMVVDPLTCGLVRGGQIRGTVGTFDGAYFVEATALCIGGSNTRDGAKVVKVGVAMSNNGGDSTIPPYGPQTNEDYMFSGVDFTVGVSTAASVTGAVAGKINVIITQAASQGNARYKLFVKIWAFGEDGFPN